MLVTGALGLAALIAFVVVELRAEHPMLPVRLFADPVLGGHLRLVEPRFRRVHLRQARGATATEAGLQVLPYVLANVAAAFAAGRLSARFGAERLLPVGYLVAAAGSFTFLLLDTATPYWLVAVAFALAGTGVGLSITPSNIVRLAGLVLLAVTVLTAVTLRKAG